MRSLAVIAALFLAVAACRLRASSRAKDETIGWSANKLYAEAKEALNDGSYAKAIKYFEKLESRYPYGRYAQQAQIDIAYAYWKDQEPASAIAACDRFIKLHPNHPNVDYVYYLRGLINFNEDLGILGIVSNQDMTERDPKGARESFDAFRELVTRFPDSKYTPDALLRMKYLVNALASLELHVARYYMKRGAYLAAANRAQYAV
jgi:outer membrane protein assembly factor BamD